MSVSLHTQLERYALRKNKKKAARTLARMKRRLYANEVARRSPKK